MPTSTIAPGPVMPPSVADRDGDHPPPGRITRLVGEIGDRSHLHGALDHLTSVNVDVISIAPTHAAHDDPHGAQT